MEREELDYMLLMDTAVLAGEIMLESGAETYRVEDTIGHFLKKAHLKHAHTFVTATGIIATLSHPNRDAITVVRRVVRSRSNLNRIYLVNTISRQFAGGEVSLEDAFRQLKETRAIVQYSQLKTNLGVVLTSAFFTLTLGGSFLDTLISAALGAILVLLMQLGRKTGIQGFLLDGFNSLVIALGALLFSQWISIPINTDLIIIGGIMPMAPGVAITNAIRDTLQGDYVSGGARMLEACMGATAIAFGTCVAMTIFY